MRLLYGLGRKFNIIEETKLLILNFFARKFPKYFAKRSKVPFIIPYLIHQLLRYHVFPMTDCSQVIGKARNKEYASQAFVCTYLHSKSMNILITSFYYFEIDCDNPRL
jgi:hypothetical protein